MARAHDDAGQAEMPTHLRREFRAEDWPGDDSTLMEGCTPTQAAVWREVGAWRRYCAARREWVREHGGSVLDEVRAQASGEQRIRERNP